MLVQLVPRKGEINRVPIGETPRLVELDLEPGQYVVSFEIRSLPSGPHRSTEDWWWTAWVASPTARPSNAPS